MKAPVSVDALPGMSQLISQLQSQAGEMTKAGAMALNKPLLSFGQEVPTAASPNGVTNQTPGWAQSSLGSYGSGANGGDPKARDAYNNRLRELGVPEHVIEGNAWNVQDESGWNFGAVGDSGAAFGANQWNGPRKEALFKFAQSRGVDPASPMTQADFWHYEMTGPYKAVYDQAVGSGNSSGAAMAILRGYEIPAETHMNRRAADYSSRGNSGGTGFTPVLAFYGR